MKLNVKALLALIVLAGMMLSAGGCVSKSEYDKLNAMNRRANERLAEAEARAKQLERDVEALQAALAERDRQLAALQQQVDLLTKANADLERALANARGGTVVKPEPLTALPAPLNEALADLARQYPELFEFFPELGMVKLKSDLTFDKGSDEVAAQAKEALAKFAQIMNTATAQTFNVYVAGHTDDIQIKKPDTLRRHPSNWYLSVHRSVAVEEVLAGAGLAQPRMAAMGFSEWHPVAANAPNRGGNSANRRVELWVVPPDRFLTADRGSVAPAAAPVEK